MMWNYLLIAPWRSPVAAAGLALGAELGELQIELVELERREEVGVAIIGSAKSP